MTPSLTPPPRKIVYPETDGLPIAENTKQYRWIVKVQGGIDSLFKNDPNVFVAGDLFWYPVEGDSQTRAAPDTMVVFGRSKGDRRSYRQWEEGGISPQVVFEVLSPSNRHAEMSRKFLFYERFGVEEYYIYDPDHHTLDGLMRKGELLVEIPEMNGWVSPRLGIRFEMDGEESVIYRPDGKPFRTFLEIAEDVEVADRRASWAEERADEERMARIQAQQRADSAQQRAEDARNQAEDALKQTEDARKQAEKFAEHLRKLGVDPVQLK